MVMPVVMIVEQPAEGGSRQIGCQQQASRQAISGGLNHRVKRTANHVLQNA
jgi:hypothetical protein